MKNIITALTLAFTTLLLTQCKKEVVEQPNVTPCSETIEVSLNADNGCSKATISGNTISWEVGDKLYVVGETDGYLGYISAQNSGTTAYFTGTITKCSTAQYFHYYYFGDKAVSDVETILKAGDYYTYDISSQNGTLDDIADNYLLMHGRSTETIASGQTNLNNITMRSMISIVKLQFGVASGTLGDKVMCTGGYSGVKFNVKTGSLNTDNTSTYRRYKKSVYLDDISSNPYYMVVLPGNQTLEFSQGLIGLSCSCPDGGFQANMLYNESNPKSVVLDEMTYLPAIFTVNKGADNEQGTDDDTQVKFSKGNLQYLASEIKWRFANKQWQYLGSAGYTDGDVTYASGNTTAQADRATQTKWIDLFGWGTSGQNHGAVCFQPWGISSTNSDYYAYGDKTKNLYDPPYTADWGCNTVYAGNVATNGWRTMNKEELYYLCCQRQNKVSMLYGHGRIGATPATSTYGVIILPDDFKLPDGLQPFKPGVQAWNNMYTYVEWEKMEVAGAVFLPTAGYRSQITISESGASGYYRTSSGLSDYDYSSACSLFFNVSTFNVMYSIYSGRTYGYSVRLVKDVVDANGNANPFGPEPW